MSQAQPLEEKQINIAWRHSCSVYCRQTHHVCRVLPWVDNLHSHLSEWLTSRSLPFWYLCWWCLILSESLPAYLVSMLLLVLEQQKQGMFMGHMCNVSSWLRFRASVKCFSDLFHVFLPSNRTSFISPESDCCISSANIFASSVPGEEDESYIQMVIIFYMHWVCLFLFKGFYGLSKHSTEGYIHDIIHL